MTWLADLIEMAVAVADDVTKTAQPTVKIRRLLGYDEFGTANYDDPVGVPYEAIVEKKNQAVKGPGGQDVLAQTYVAILEPIPNTSGATQPRHEPLDENDIIILPDGTTGPILNIGGLVNAKTNRPYYHEIWLG